GIVARCWWLRLRSLFGRSKTWDQDHLDAIVETLKSIMHAARVLVGFRIETEGELQLGRPGRPLGVISRHAGPADSLALGWLLARAGRIPRIVLADAMLWDPGVATVLHRLHSYFVPSRSGAGDDRTKGVAELAKSLRGEDARLIFPEGRSWSPVRFEEQVGGLQQRGWTGPRRPSARRGARGCWSRAPGGWPPSASTPPTSTCSSSPTPGWRCSPARGRSCAPCPSATGCCCGGGSSGARRCPTGPRRS